MKLDDMKMGDTKMGDMGRHIDACTNAVLPGGRRRLLLGEAPVGWAGTPGVGPLVLPDEPALAALAAQMEAAGRFAPRGELFDVRNDDTGQVVARVDRGALPALGIAAAGVHMNGLVRRGRDVRVWVARRAADKKLEPGKLDHLVAGGVSAGMSFDDTLLKEAEEEAGLPPDLTRCAARVATIRYATLREEGLRRDLLACYDLWLPVSFQPRAVDGEVAGFELWPVDEVADRVRRTNDFKFNVNLVLIDLFLRLGILPQPEADALRREMARVLS